MGYLDKLPLIRETLRRQREEQAKVASGTASSDEAAAVALRNSLAKENLEAGFERHLDSPEHNPFEDLPPGVSMEDNLVTVGKMYQAHSLEHDDEDEDAALNLLIAWVAEKYEETRNPAWMQAYETLRNPFGEALYFFAAKWAHYGLNKVKVDDKYAASLICTKVSQEVLDGVKLPWPAFFVEVPPGLIPMGKGDHVMYLLVDHWRTAKTFRTTIITARGRQAELLGPTLGGLVADNADDETIFFGGGSLSDRARTAIGRLLIGLCLAITDPTTHKVWAPIGPRKHTFGNARKGSNPAVRIYQVGKPVKVDCRPLVIEYLSGEPTGRKLTVQLYVAGYWRWQPYGPKSTLRRWQHIEGHWKGPVDAPINVRPHVVSGG